MLSIGTFSKISKVTTNTLRYYDEIGLLKPRHIGSENGYRYYDVEQLNTILLINKLKLYSFSLEEISEIIKDPNDDSMLLHFMKQKQDQIQDKLKFYQYALNQMENDITNLERGIHIMSYLDNIEVKLIETEPKNILFVREEMSTKDYGKYMGKLYETIVAEKLTVTGPPITIFHTKKEFNPDCYDNEIAIPVKEAIKGTRELAGGLCIMATLNGPYTELPSIYTKLQQWIEKEEYTPASEPYEIYLTDPGQTAPENNITEIYMPVKK